MELCRKVKNMEKDTLTFVKYLVEKQYKFVQEGDNNNAGKIAAGLFDNPEFYHTVFDFFGAGWVKETRSEFLGDPKDLILITLVDIISRIEDELISKK